MFGHLNVTLGASAAPVTASRLAVRWFAASSEAANSIYLGGPTVTNSDYGFLLAATTGKFDSGGFSPTCFDLNTLWATGTQSQVFHILYVLA